MWSLRHAPLSAATFIFLAALLAAPVVERPVPRQSAAAHALHAASVPFVENAGQAPAEARFTARTFAGTVHVTEAGELVYALPSEDHVVVLRERSAEPRESAVAGIDAAATRVSLFQGDDPDGWVRGAATWDGVRIGEVADGVALEVRARGRNVEKLFHVAPGAEAASIRMTIDGAEGLDVADGGALDVRTRGGTLRFTPPVAFQPGDDGDDVVACAYAVTGDTYSFRVGTYDPTRPLVIDPLIASTFLGGSLPDIPYEIAVAGDSVYVAGEALSLDFPTTTGAYQETWVSPTGNGFVAQMSSDLTTLTACTFLGGTGLGGTIEGLLVTDSAVFVTGGTNSTDHPTTPGAFQPSAPAGGNAFVSRLSRDLSTLEASTYVGGGAGDEAHSIAEGPQGVYVLGWTASSDFPVPAGSAYETDIAGGVDAFVVRLDTDLSSLSAGTLYGGALTEEPSTVRVHGGDVWIVGTTPSLDLPTVSPAAAGPYQPSNAASGRDAFVARFDAGLGSLIAATYLGGGDGISFTFEDYGYDLGFQDGDVFVQGFTEAVAFPTTPGAFDRELVRNDYKVFVSRLSADLSTLEASTFLGGSGYQHAQSMIVDERGVFVAGLTKASDFPVAPQAYDTSFDGGGEAFVSALSLDLTKLRGSTFLGSPTNNDENVFDIAASGDGFYVLGNTKAGDFPTTPGAYDRIINASSFFTDAFIAHFELTLSGEDPPDPPDPVIDSFFLPKKLDVKVKEGKPEKSRLIANGWFDTGSQEADFTQPAVLTVGETTFQVPRLSPKGKWHRYEEGAVLFLVKPSRYGSSKAKFRLIVTGTAALAVDPDEPVVIRYESGDIDAVGEVKLTNGRYKLGKVRGALVQPALALYNCKTGVKGDDKDSIRLRLGLSTGEGTPDVPPPLTVTMGEGFTETIPTGAFERRGDKYAYKGDPGGIGKAVLDYRKEKLNVAGKKVEVGDFPEGPQPVRITIQLGDEELTVICRLVRAGTNLRY